MHAFEVSQRFVFSPAVKEHADRCTLHTVNPQELRFLGKLFRDLASRSSGNTVDRRTFLQFFPLPVREKQGIWGERLFDNFDPQHRGAINFDEFVTGLSLCTKASEDDKYRLMFSLYDLKSDGVIDKVELKTMVRSIQLYNTFKHTVKTSAGNDVYTSEVPSPRSPQDLYLRRRGSERRSSAALIKRDDEGSPANVDFMASKIMTDLEAVDKLDFEQFKRFLSQNPRIMEVFTQTFKEELWSSRLRDMSNTRSIEVPNVKSCCGFRVRSGTVLKVSTKATSSFAQEKSSWVLRKTREQTTPDKVYIVLRSGMLLIYQSPATPMPMSVIFLEGCFIDKLAEFSQSHNHGFAISHQFESFQQVSFWCESNEERNEWVLRLSQAARNSKLEDFYVLSERIGSGRFSDVFKALERSSSFEWAVKVIEKTRLSSEEHEMLRSEVAIMRLLNHPNVVQMKEVFEDKGKMYLIVELVEGGELFDRIRTKRVFTEFTAFHVTRQLLQTVKYLHEAGIVHRDIKPENILLSDDSELPTIKLADFGLAKLVGTSECLLDGCGTLGYVAPEVLLEHPYGKQVDMWSVGVVTYLMLRGRLPFDSKEKFMLIEKTIEAEPDFPEDYWGKFTPYASDFVSKLLCKDPALRLTCDQALSHVWIRNGEVVIPRKINKTALADSLKKTITNSKMQRELFTEHPKAATLGPEPYDNRVIYTDPDVFEDMQVERRPAELSLARIKRGSV